MTNSWPDLGEFYDALEEQPIPRCIDNMTAFVDLWPEGEVLTSNLLYGHGQLMKFSTVEIRRAIWQLMDEGRLVPVQQSKNPRRFYVMGLSAPAKTPSGSAQPGTVSAA
jgi:hypothetical protein